MYEKKRKKRTHVPSRKYNRERVRNYCALDCFYCNKIIGSNYLTSHRHMSIVDLAFVTTVDLCVTNDVKK
jgi:hypothetical protein